MGISIIKGELIHSSADAIVHMVGHSFLSGGADSKLYQAAGPELYRACTTLGVCLTDVYKRQRLRSFRYSCRRYGRYMVGRPHRLASRRSYRRAPLLYA